MKHISRHKKNEKDLQGKNDVSYNRDGEAIIHVSVKEDSGFLSPYSIDGKEVISSELAIFLEDAVKEIPPKCDVHLEISGDTIDAHEQEVYPKAIHQYYKMQLVDINRKLNRNKMSALIMLIIGIAVLGLYITLSFSLLENHVFAEVIDIAAWVFVWEAVDLFFITRKEILWEKKKYSHLYNASVGFKNNRYYY